MSIALLLLCFALILTACGSNNSNTSNGNLKTTLKVAMDVNPQTLDPLLTTGSITKDVMKNVYETLITVDAKYHVQPMLASSYGLSDDGKTYTFKLRHGVKFQNGKPMTADDVIASLERWYKLNTSAAATLGKAKFVKTANDTVQIKLAQRRFGVLDTIAQDGVLQSFIMPKSTIDRADKATGLKEFIGTGPYKFVTWKKDQFVELSKFKGYKPVNAKSSGMSGKKVAYVNKIYINFITDPSARLNGLLSGQYDIATSILYNNYDQLKNSSSVKAYNGGVKQGIFVFNKKHGIFTNPDMRQAVQLALNDDKIMQAAYSGSGKNFYRINPALMFKEQPDWYSEVGSEYYNQHDKAKAKSLLAKANYKKQPVVILTSKDYMRYYDMSVELQQQLKAVGVNASLKVADWATMLNLRNDPTKYDISVTGVSMFAVPTQLLPFNPSWPGWSNSSKISGLMDKINASKDNKEASKYFEEIQKYNYEKYVGWIKTGDFYELQGASNKVKGYKPFDNIILWNMKVEE